jgi:hypothetical protein
MATTTEEATHLYEASATLRENRARYLAKNGFGDGGYEDSWVTLKQVGPLKLGFPNTASRKRAIRLHDLHHVLAQYGTDFTGEAEIGGFEIGAGCGRHWAAWFLNAGAMSFGILTAPRATYRGFIRGRHARSLYGGEWREELLDENTGEMRKKLGLTEPERPATPSENLQFAAWAIGTPIFFYGPLVIPLALAARAFF